jgi:hypothetical protein
MNVHVLVTGGADFLGSQCHQKSQLETCINQAPCVN